LRTFPKSANRNSEEEEKSMLGSIFIGLSGMTAYSKGLQIISNNVANLNTLGFKAATLQFGSLYESGNNGGLSYLGSNYASQGGQGVRLGSSFTDFKSGELRQTGRDLDLAIDGAGFLVLLHNDQVFYTRTGQFDVDKDGFITDQRTGYQLGVLDPDGKAVPVQIDTKRVNPAVATTRISMSGQLLSGDSNSEVVAKDIVVYDDAGTAHKWTVTVTKPTSADGTGVWTVKATDFSGMTVDTLDSGISFIGSAIDPATARITMSAHPDHASPMSVVLDFNAVTSAATGPGSSLSGSAVDGNAKGDLMPITIDETGHVLLTYTNQKKEQLGAVAIADFRNPQGLKQLSNALFQNVDGGEMQLRASGKDGVGNLVTKQLEASNVDLSAEFGELILVQRGFQACSQVVSVSNDMIQQLFGIRGQA
jgi:flagellar hook protein FlgE